MSLLDALDSAIANVEAQKASERAGGQDGHVDGGEVGEEEGWLSVDGGKGESSSNPPLSVDPLSNR